jgi:hypothetical protein
MAKTNFNYAGPGARVGIQAGTAIITGGVRVTDDDVVIDGQVTADDEDVRGHFKDPHVDPELRRLDGFDNRVIAAVMGTAGIPAFLEHRDIDRPVIERRADGA